MLEVDVLKAICSVMRCDICPSPCGAKEKSSLANCVHHWSEILSKIDPNCNWKEARYQCGSLFILDED